MRHSIPSYYTGYSPNNPEERNCAYVLDWLYERMTDSSARIIASEKNWELKYQREQQPEV